MRTEVQSKKSIDKKHTCDEKAGKEARMRKFLFLLKSEVLSSWKN
jgi:hypothetical protein